MPNYQEAFKFFQKQNSITLNDISTINMSRKGTSYDGEAFDIYEKIVKVVNNKNNANILELWEASDTKWRSYLFKADTKITNLKTGCLDFSIAYLLSSYRK